MANTVQAPWVPRQASLRSSPHVSPPYTPEEISGFWAAAEHQATARRGRVIRVMLAFGLGAGLHSGKLASLRVRDVRPHPRRGEILVCHLAQRAVPIRADLADVVRAVLAEAPHLYLLGHSHGHTKNPFGVAVKGLQTPPWLPRLKMTRLRTTWGVTLLTEGIRVSEFGLLSGSTSARTIEELAAHVPARPEVELFLTATGARHPRTQPDGLTTHIQPRTGQTGTIRDYR